VKRVATHTPGALSHDFGGHRYNFEPILDDASPIPSRFAAPLDSGAGGVWLAGEPWPEEQPVYSQRISWKASQSIMYVVRGNRMIYVGPWRNMDLVLRPRRRGQRPAGMPRSAWWRLSRRERRQIGGAP
jgi:hypothetical protein